jgi:peptidoglycan/LPS O-acetylase OafA/YrhL
MWPRQRADYALTPLQSLACQQPDYLHSLDTARGLAALAVVLWHWQHFFFNGSVPGDFNRHEQPFYSVLSLFYEKGWFAVDFFFALSGFVFFWLYAGPIEQRRVNLRDFFFLRLSRLYPLHLLTLLLVAGLQWLSLRNHGGYFVYQLNDAYHFVLHLFFASAWGLEKGFSFNAPIWSVSVEVLLYAVFFLTARLLTIRSPHALLLAISGLFVYGYSELIGRGLFAFYMGALVYFAYQKLLLTGLIRKCAKPLLLVYFVAWLLTILEFRLGILQAELAELCTASCTTAGLARAKALWVTGFLLPSTILVLAVSETLGLSGWKRTAWLGEISYASYLLHFPLQLVFFMLFTEVQPGREIFYSPVLWLGYFALLIAISLLAHRHFERPTQRWIRRISLDEVGTKI